MPAEHERRAVRRRSAVGASPKRLAGLAATEDRRHPMNLPLAGGQRVVRLTLGYRGDAFAGWARQSPTTTHGLDTVQGVLEHALADALGQPTSCTAAGRTDAGVHAEGQVVSFATSSTIPADGLRRVLTAAPARRHLGGRRRRRPAALRCAPRRAAPLVPLRDLARRHARQPRGTDVLCRSSAGST